MVKFFFYFFIYVFIGHIASPTLSAMQSSACDMSKNSITLKLVKETIKKLNSTEYPIPQSLTILFNAQTNKVLSDIQALYTLDKFIKIPSTIDRQNKFRNQFYDTIKRTYNKITDTEERQRMLIVVFKASIAKLAENNLLSDHMLKSCMHYETKLQDHSFFRKYTFTTYLLLAFNSPRDYTDFRDTLIQALYFITNEQKPWYALIQEFSPVLLEFKSLENEDKEGLSILIENIDVIVEKLSNAAINAGTLLGFCFPTLLAQVPLETSKPLIVKAIIDLLEYRKIHGHFNNTGACHSPLRIHLPKSPEINNRDEQEDDLIFNYEEESS